MIDIRWEHIIYCRRGRGIEEKISMPRAVTLMTILESDVKKKFKKIPAPKGLGEPNCTYNIISSMYICEYKSTVSVIYRVGGVSFIKRAILYRSELHACACTYIIYNIYRQQILMPPIDEYYIVNDPFFGFGHNKCDRLSNDATYITIYYV